MSSFIIALATTRSALLSALMSLMAMNSGPGSVGTAMGMPKSGSRWSGGGTKSARLRSGMATSGMAMSGMVRSGMTKSSTMRSIGMPSGPGAWRPW